MDSTTVTWNFFACWAPGRRRGGFCIDKPISNVTTMAALVDRAVGRSRFNGQAPAALVRLVTGEGLGLVAAGAAAGLLLAIGAAACAGPALRASRTDPGRALRAE